MIRPKITTVIKDGKPATGNDTSLLTRFPENVQAAVKEWIRLYLTPTKKTPCPWTSYTLKHILERDLGLYMTNNQFKHAMLLCGYQPVDEHVLNWHFCISRKSPALKPDLSRTVSMTREEISKAVGGIVENAQITEPQ